MGNEEELQLISRLLHDKTVQALQVPPSVMLLPLFPRPEHQECWVSAHLQRTMIKNVHTFKNGAKTTALFKKCSELPTQTTGKGEDTKKFNIEILTKIVQTNQKSYLQCLSSYYI